MISEWLKSDYIPNWEALISALRSPIVGLHSLAIELEDKLGKVSACISLSLSLLVYIILVQIVIFTDTL